ncbi:hypothetical protein PR202_ga14936 [Eleusine coracana subsp. coracana]|uniref:non-specific serine/threonine protein kinase n=1 Tax=Eleusine coracana subsp. coracana TaxID=191504 RepID=A0AAV5CIZ0_ELECO|nr:hypothetical protein PR202_ga14936 [Eleusine coracana subsp. coracana]
MAIVDRSLLFSVVHLALFLLPAVVAARTRSSLTAGDILTPPSYITSPSGDFAFGFHSLDSNDSFLLLAIWFQFDGTVVWFATDSSSGSAVLATPHSVLSFTAAGQLSLDNSLWNPDTDQVQSDRSLLVLRDSGNLQLVRADGTAIIWESFQHPTDTLLPGQLMRPGTRLRSRGTNTNIASMRRFSLVVQTDGNIVMYMLDQPGTGSANNAYWSTGTCCVDNGNTTLFFDDVDSAAGAGHLYYVLTDGSKRNLTTTPFSQILQHSNTTASRLYYQHATLDPDGIFRVYIVPRRNTAAAGRKWAVVDMFPSDGCKTVTNSLHGMCGPNSYCIYRTDNKQLDCECPSGYTFLDAQFRYKGCIPSFVQDTCDGEIHSSEFKLVELPNTNWARSISYQTHTSVTEERCSDLCLSNCLCAAALFDGNSSSCSEASILTSGWQTNDTSVRTLIKVRTKRPPLRALIPHYLMIAGLSVLVLVTTCILVVHCYITKQQQNARKKDHLNARVFTRKELYRATNGFNKLLGQGGFGKIKEGNAERIIIQGDNEALQDLQRVERFTHVAMCCVQVDPSARPTMRSVVWMLEGTADVPPLPDPSPRARNDFSAILSSASTGTHDQSNVE